MTVRLAEHDLSVPGETNLVTRSVSRIINHGNYEPGTEKNDIALMKLSSPVTVGKRSLLLSAPVQVKMYYSPFPVKIIKRI